MGKNYKYASLFLAVLAAAFFSCASSPNSVSSSGPAPKWVNNIEQAYPSGEWVAVAADITRRRFYV